MIPISSVDKSFYSYLDCLTVPCFFAFLLCMIAGLVTEQNDVKPSGVTEVCIDRIYYLKPMESQTAISLVTISSLTQLPNFSAQYNFDTFLIQFQTKIRTRESSDWDTFKSCVIALGMAFIFYLVINFEASKMIVKHNLKDDPDTVHRIMVYESLLLWPSKPLSISLTIIFFFTALLNVVFTTFITYEQVTMLIQELRHKEESIRVERYL